MAVTVVTESGTHLILNVVVDVAGTAVRLLPTYTPVFAFVVQAKDANTNNVHVGSSEVDNTGNTGIELSSRETVELNSGNFRDILDLSQWWVDADTSGEGMVVVAIKVR